MSITNDIWKIKDTKTGLYWGGPIVECSHDIGTRFVCRNSLDVAVRSISQKKGRFPDHWVIERVRLHETIEYTIPASSVNIDHLIGPAVDGILKSRGFHESRVHLIGVAVRCLRRETRLHDVAVIAIRDKKYRGSWSKLRKALEELGVSKDRFNRFAQGPGDCMTFKDDAGAMVAIMGEVVSDVIDVPGLIEELAVQLNVPEDAI